MSNFHVGQKVVCTRTFTRASELGIHQPQKGDVFTIREIYQCPLKNIVGLRFVEINCPISPEWQLEYGWDARHFRPVHTTSIEIFQKMLAPIPRKELVTSLTNG